MNNNPPNSTALQVDDMPSFIRRGPAPPEEDPRAFLPPRPRVPMQAPNFSSAAEHSDRSIAHLADLERALGAMPREVPQEGIDASRQIQRAFEQVASDVENIATERVEQALALQDEAKQYAAVLRETGRVLCQKIEGETTRASHVSMVIRTVQDRLRGPA